MKNKIMLLITVLSLLFCFGCDKTKTEEGEEPAVKTEKPGKTEPSYVSSNSIFSRPVVEKPEGGRKDWNDVSSFVCYYGDFDFEFQSKFDVVIMHTATLKQYSKEEAQAKVKQLQDAGCYIVSYITIGEDDTLNVGDGLGEGGYASYYIYENGQPKMNTNWNSWFVDAGNPVWQAKVIEETQIAEEKTTTVDEPTKVVEETPIVEEKAVEEELRGLRRDKTVSGYVANCLALGYDKELALKAAEAMADNDAAAILACQQEFLEKTKKEMEAAALNKQPKLTSGAPPTAQEADKDALNKTRSYFGLPPIK